MFKNILNSKTVIKARMCKNVHGRSQLNQIWFLAARIMSFKMLNRQWGGRSLGCGKIILPI